MSESDHEDRRNDYSPAAQAVMDYHFQADVPEARLPDYMKEHAELEARGLINTGGLEKRIFDADISMAKNDAIDAQDLSPHALKKLGQLMFDEPELWHESATIHGQMRSLAAAVLMASMTGADASDLDRIRIRVKELKLRQAEVTTELFHKMEPLDPAVAIELCR